MKILKKVLGAIAAALLFLSVSFTANAATYISEALGGTNQQTGYLNLGDGDKILTVRGDAGSGTAYAMKINKYLPHKPEAQVSVSAGLTGRAGFRANKYVGNSGTFQSYYVKWVGSSSSKAYVRVID